MAAVLAENYQLKWHSHSTHLHSSVATLYRSDNFTDVTLMTSDGRFLAAHRFVLSACSSYLSRVLQVGLAAGNPNANMVIVLPPDITYRTLAILLQYMYSGEATVSNEQLSGVLRAGEILRIKGLCHDGNKDKRHSGNGESASRSGSSNSDRIPVNNYYIHSNQSSIRNRPTDGITPSSYSHCKSSQTGVRVATVEKTAAESSKKSSDVEPTVVKSHQPKETQKQATVTKSSHHHHRLTPNDSPQEPIVDIHSNPDSGEIIIEDSMKIELLVKEEPLDWDDDDGQVSHDDSQDRGITAKQELFIGDDVEENIYAPLTCDMCQETFMTPALWVRHIETHPVTDVPQKKRKKNQGDNDDEDDEFPLLRCELCQKVFTTPADWVKHIQSSHTEEQLALSNSSRTVRKSSRVACLQCNKTFPSLASMLIHSRTHTGEKPYICCVCEKGFNVKSNLLRHLRTLHDHLLHPSHSGSGKES